MQIKNKPTKLSIITDTSTPSTADSDFALMVSQVGARRGIATTTWYATEAGGHNALMVVGSRGGRNVDHAVS